MGTVRVGVVGVGSRTVRLLVARATAGSIVPLCRERTVVGLGDDLIRHGTISETRLARLVDQVSELAGLARAMSVEELEVVLTAPGREASNAAVLKASVGHAAAAPVSTLSVEELAEAAFDGAMIGNRVAAEPVAVCDVGATSTVVAIGTRQGGLAYVRAVPLGSLTLSVALGRERPAASALASAREIVASAFERLIVPLPKTALVTGGAGRSLRKLVGRSVDLDAVDAALRIARRCSGAEIVRIHGLPPHRAETLAADTLIMRELHRRLAVPLEVSNTGHREGVAARLGMQLTEAA